MVVKKKPVKKPIKKPAKKPAKKPPPKPPPKPKPPPPPPPPPPKPAPPPLPPNPPPRKPPSVYNANIKPASLQFFQDNIGGWKRTCAVGGPIWPVKSNIDGSVYEASVICDYALKH